MDSSYDGYYVLWGTCDKCGRIEAQEDLYEGDICEDCVKLEGSGIQ
jgi:hypothetical protein